MMTGKDNERLESSPQVDKAIYKNTIMIITMMKAMSLAVIAEVLNGVNSNTCSLFLSCLSQVYYQKMRYFQLQARRGFI